MADFSLEIGDLLAREGGYSNSKTDLGGETKYGISKRQYQELDIPSLTAQQASEIYLRDFWEKFRISEIVNQQVAKNVFDMIVNMGYMSAIRCLQKALKYPGAEVDGVMGSGTIRTVNGLDPDKLISSLKLERINYYLQIVMSNRLQLTNFSGWIKRTLEL